MEILKIEGTLTTPTVNADFDKGVIEISGRSNPENSIEFFKPLMEWAEEYIKNPREKTTIHINMEHFNSSSSKCLLGFFKIFEPSHRAKKEILVYWHYEDDDDEMLEAGETYQVLTGLPFNMIPY
ncbi:MAG: hypothetical protein AMS27_16175 [Bacteroides sp. SM23_62_1]|nr:MAG: hypothetical protein AMS27_16175 [Bacteroides sp. SM23_62_1]